MVALTWLTTYVVNQHVKHVCSRVRDATCLVTQHRFAVVAITWPPTTNSRSHGTKGVYEDMILDSDFTGINKMS